MSILIKNKYLRPIIPVCVLLYMAFGEWVYSYYFAYCHVYKRWHDKTSMVTLLIIVNIIWIIALVSWLMVSVVGPGHLPMAIPPFDLEKYICNGEKSSVVSSTNVHKNDIESLLSAATTPSNDLIKCPPIFECDSNGLPFWCSECSTLKLLRSHHSSITNKCVPFFDHYCSFMGSTIGKRNYWMFSIYVFAIQSLLFLSWISIAVYCGSNHSINAAFIVFVAISGILSFMVLNVSYNLINDLIYGDTTIERLHRQRWMKFERNNKDGFNDIFYSSFVNVQDPTNPGLRLVIELKFADRPFDNGFWKNLRVWFMNFDCFKTPQELSDFQYSLFSDKFKEVIQNRINDGEYMIFGAMKNLQ